MLSVQESGVCSKRGGVGAVRFVTSQSREVVKADVGMQKLVGEEGR